MNDELPPRAPDEPSRGFAVISTAGAVFLTRLPASAEMTPAQADRFAEIVRHHAKRARLLEVGTLKQTLVEGSFV